MKYKTELKDKSPRGVKNNLTCGAFGKRKKYTTLDMLYTNYERHIALREAKQRRNNEQKMSN